MATPLNESHVSFLGHLYNSSLLEEFNYTIYPGNGTLSNSSYCYLAFPPYSVPLTMLANGSIVNGSACESNINPIYIRGGLGIAFGVCFGVLIVLGLTCLSKHGKMHLPADRNFRLVSRRWPWYWFLVAAATAMASSLTAIDVDRTYLQGTALILTNVFYYVSLPAMLASIWEMTRHWGSWCERQLADEDTFRFLHGDKRSKIEFYIPLVFYLFGFMTFFLSVLRSWTKIPKGSIADATDPRFKAASLFALLAYCVILASVYVTLRYYPPVSRRMPWKIPACLLIILIRIVYNIAVAWNYDIGPMKFNAPEAYIYALGYAPILGCMIVMVTAGLIEMNDDEALKVQRGVREAVMDKEVGIAKKARTRLPNVDEIVAERQRGLPGL